MFATEKYLKLFNAPDPDKEISRMSEADSKQILKTMVRFFHDQDDAANGFIQFLHEEKLV